MRERVRQFGGHLEIETDRNGTTVSATIPNRHFRTVTPVAAAQMTCQMFGYANLAPRLRLMTLRQNSQAVRGPDQLAHRNPGIQPADLCSETSKVRKKFTDSPANSCQCFWVMDAPEIYQSPGLGVVNKFLTAIQASDVCSSAIGISESG